MLIYAIAHSDQLVKKSQCISFLCGEQTLGSYNNKTKAKYQFSLTTLYPRKDLSVDIYGPNLRIIIIQAFSICISSLTLIALHSQLTALEGSPASIMLLDWATLRSSVLVPVAVGLDRYSHASGGHPPPGFNPPWRG